MLPLHIICIPSYRLNWISDSRGRICLAWLYVILLFLMFALMQQTRCWRKWISSSQLREQEVRSPPTFSRKKRVSAPSCTSHSRLVNCWRVSFDNLHTYMMFINEKYSPFLYDKDVHCKLTWSLNSQDDTWGWWESEPPSCTQWDSHSEQSRCSGEKTNCSEMWRSLSLGLCC